MPTEPTLKTVITLCSPMHRISLLAMVGLCLLAPATGVAQQIGWTQRPSGGHSPSVWHAMAYDSVRGVIVMFGGYNESSSWNGETWEWSGTTWIQRMIPGPSPRGLHAMAYDSARGVTVLFGGYAAGTGFNGETWEWDGSS